jgi:YegS/Rv2252/BmrU family lipid kinase
MKRIAFIINPIAGIRKKVDVSELIRRHIDSEAFEYRIYHTEYKGHAQILAAQAVEEGFDIVAASGGDGTINEIARALIHTQVSLAILPMGSGNGLARHLGIPLHIPDALRLINRLQTKRIDTGLFNNAVFLSNAGTGFVACVAESFDHKKSFRGFWGYSLQTLKHFFSYKPVNCHITCHDKQWSGYFFTTNACNSNQFGYEARVAPDARLNDGKLEMVLVRKTTIPSYTLLMFYLFFGNVYRHPSVIHVQGTSLHIETDSPVHFQVDGEPLGKNSTFQAQLNPLSLSVLIP